LAQRSIRRGLIAVVVVSQSLLAVGLLLAGVYFTRRQLLAALDSNLQAKAMSVAAIIRYTEEEPPQLAFDPSVAPTSLERKHPDFYRVATENGEVLAQSPSWPTNFEVNPGKHGYWNFREHGRPYRGLHLSHVPVLDREPGQLQAYLVVDYAIPTSELEEQVRAAAIYIALASVTLLGFTVLLALAGIRRGLLPVQRLANEASVVSGENWEFRPPEEAREVAELEPLTQALSTMVERLHKSFLQQREFLGNAAHELKTPVAILKSTLQALEQRPRTGEEYREGLAHALEDLDRLEQLLQWMLRLARAEQWAQGARRRDLEEIDLAETCLAAMDRLNSLAEARRIHVNLLNAHAVPIVADPEDLQLIWVNLLENAIRHCPEGSGVEIRISDAGDARASVVFEDHGSGIPEEELPHIFERFHRADSSRARSTGGFGLGLAIAKALVEAYGGQITASSRLGSGTKVAVVLPVSTKAALANTLQPVSG
jgi:signal transduction histidine kinase